MPRCLLCKEWAGPDSDLHDHCVAEFKRQMAQAGLFSRMLTGLRRAIRFVFSAISGPAAR
jgi:hypothetical protein